MLHATINKPLQTTAEQHPQRFPCTTMSSRSLTEHRGQTLSIGIIYAMTTVVPGLIKIGKTGSDNFNQRMYNLERNGYFNVTGLSRHFAIEVEDYDEKERMLDDIFSRSRVPGSELFALDIDLVVQLLSSFEGRQVYPNPKIISKEESFDQASSEYEKHAPCCDPHDSATADEPTTDMDFASKQPQQDKPAKTVHRSTVIPDGKYYLKQRGNNGEALITCMVVQEGAIIVPKGSLIKPTSGKLEKGLLELRKARLDQDGRVLEDTFFDSPSTAATFVAGSARNGWQAWTTTNGQPIDIFRKK